MCLLALISEGPCYGYEMVRKMEERGLELVGEGSIYPLLSRLQKGGLIEGYMVPSKEGPKRKYYRTLPRGEEQLRAWRKEWEEFSRGVDRVVGKEEGGL
jgi:PadR family transcriptional regulator PadR